jgi:hypothetical protein
MPAYAPASAWKNAGTDAGVAGLEAHSTECYGAGFDPPDGVNTRMRSLPVSAM